jgi:cytoskeletal protein CcmA (bactofilin family)
MSNASGHNSAGLAIIGPDLVITGEVRNGGHVEIHGRIDGSIAASHVQVHRSGVVLGSLNANSAEIDGQAQGQLLVRQLLQIGSSGRVQGDVRYGQLAMQAGAELSADVRNVPPEIAGDLNLTVKRGQSVLITTDDLNAIDPDSPQASLVFAVSRPVGGFVARAQALATPIDRFALPELRGYGVVFVHDGSTVAIASFDITVSDQTGATSGAAKTVHVAVFR